MTLRKLRRLCAWWQRRIVLYSCERFERDRRRNNRHYLRNFCCPEGTMLDLRTGQHTAQWELWWREQERAERRWKESGPGRRKAKEMLNG